jgi:hypothetical protein
MQPNGQGGALGSYAAGGSVAAPPLGNVPQPHTDTTAAMFEWLDANRQSNPLLQHLNTPLGAHLGQNPSAQQQPNLQQNGQQAQSPAQRTTPWPTAPAAPQPWSGSQQAAPQQWSNLQQNGQQAAQQPWSGSQQAQSPTQQATPWPWSNPQQAAQQPWSGPQQATPQQNGQQAAPQTWPGPQQAAPQQWSNPQQTPVAPQQWSGSPQNGQRVQSPAPQATPQPWPGSQQATLQQAQQAPQQDTLKPTYSSEDANSGLGPETESSTYLIFHEDGSPQVVTGVSNKRSITEELRQRGIKEGRDIQYTIQRIS